MNLSGETNVSEEVSVGTEVVVLGPKDVEPDLDGVAAAEPAHVILKLFGVGSIALVPPRVLIQTCHSVAECHVQDSVNVRQVRSEPDQAKLVYYFETVLG